MADDLHQQVTALNPWFYEFDLGAYGRTESALPPEVRPIHQTRLDMVNRIVDGYFGDRLRDIRCVDVGCHEGYYSVAMARKGLRHVRGLDVREASVAKARFVARALDLKNVEFAQQNIEQLKPDHSGPYELCLFLGLLYHVENPMLCLRNIAAVTQEICVIETQVIDEVTGVTEWGAQNWTHPYQGVLALVDESAEFDADNTETGSVPLVSCPSPLALHSMLKYAGFRRSEIISPPPGAYEQHARGKRVVCVAYK